MSSSKGQSTLEFILTFSMVFAFFFSFLKMALNYTDGYMVHYATFLASRTYMAADNEAPSVQASDPAAVKQAQAIFNKYLPSALISNLTASIKENNADTIQFPAFVGLWTLYSPVFSLGAIGGSSTVDLRSESFLGREPTRFEGYQQTCAAIKLVTQSGCATLATLDDNGG